MLLDQLDDPNTDALVASFVWDDEEELASSSPEHVACAGALSDFSVKTNHSKNQHSDLGEPPPGILVVVRISSVSAELMVMTPCRFPG